MSGEYKEERKCPWTTAELFLKIRDNLKEKGLLPEILDYAVPTSSQMRITTEEFRLRNNLDYGGSEGIYLDVLLEFRDTDGKTENKGLGTFKTLDTNRDAMHTMSNLLADFLLELNAFVQENMDDFTWEGVDVIPCDGDGQRAKWSLTCGNLAKAMQRKDELLEKYPIVKVRNNADRKVTVYRRTDQNQD